MATTEERLEALELAWANLQVQLNTEVTERNNVTVAANVLTPIVDALNARVTDLENRANTIETQVSDHESRITVLENPA